MHTDCVTAIARLSKQECEACLFVWGAQPHCRIQNVLMYMLKCHPQPHSVLGVGNCALSPIVYNANPVPCTRKYDM